MKHLTDRVVDRVNRAAVSKATRDVQYVQGAYCEGFCYYLTKQDWTDIEEKSPSSACEAICWRANACGMGCASERLKGVMAVILMVINSKNTKPFSQQLKDKKNDISKILKELDNSAPEWPFDNVTMCPRSPLELPEDVRKHIYGED